MSSETVLLRSLMGDAAAAASTPLIKSFLKIIIGIRRLQRRANSNLYTARLPGGSHLIFAIHSATLHSWISPRTSATGPRVWRYCGETWRLRGIAKWLIKMAGPKADHFWFEVVIEVYHGGRLITPPLRNFPSPSIDLEPDDCLTPRKGKDTPRFRLFRSEQRYSERVKLLQVLCRWKIKQSRHSSGDRTTKKEQDLPLPRQSSTWTKRSPS